MSIQDTSYADTQICSIEKFPIWKINAEKTLYVYFIICVMTLF